MDDPERFPWDLSMVADAMDGVVRHLHLDARQAQVWKAAAWVNFVAKAARLAADFRGDCSARTFLGAVLLADGRDWLRRWNRAPERRHRPLDEMPRTVLDGVSATRFFDPLVADEAAYEYERALDALDRAIDTLPPDERLLVHEHYLRGMAWNDVARRLGCEPSTARQRGHRVLAKLRALVSGCIPG